MGFDVDVGRCIVISLFTQLLDKYGLVVLCLRLQELGTLKVSGERILILLEVVYNNFALAV